MKIALLNRLKYLFILIFLTNCVFAQSQKYYRVQVTLSPAEFRSLMQAGLDVDHFQYQNDILIADISEADLQLLKQRRINIKYLIKDIGKNINRYNGKIDKKAARSGTSMSLTVPTPSNFGTGGSYGPAGSVTRHFTFQEMQNELDDMRTLFPNLITVKSSIGTSDQGRPLLMVRISDNADVDENEPEIFLNAVHHAREPISMTQLIFFMWHLLENYASNKEIQTLVNSTELYIVPCVNPDGYVYNATNNNTGGGMWRKNRHDNGNGTFGVDNNRNYSYGWGLNNGSSTSTSSDTYRGTSPFSEVENIAIRNFCNSRSFVSEFNCHSYGNYCIYPYSYVGVNNNPEIPLFTQLSSFLTSDNGFTYGNSSATVNYIASGVAEDWAYGEQTTKGKMYGFTPEVGAGTDGFYPAASRILPLCNSMVEMNKNLMKVSTAYGVVSTSAPSVISGLSGSIPFSLKHFGIYPASYIVSLLPISSFVSYVDAPKNISGSTIFQIQNDVFSFSIDPLTPIGSIILFEVGTDNGYCVRRDTISITYTCASPGGSSTTGITTNSATISWNGISGVTDYYYSSKLASSAIWDADVLVSGSTSATLSSLLPNTAYTWRVRDINCATYSAIQSFTTLQVCGVPTPTASSVTSSGFTLSWPVISSATSYDVRIRQQGTPTWTTSTIFVNVQSYSGLLSNTVYEFEVNATCPSGTGSFSLTQTVSTLIIPTVVYCNSNGSNATKEWIDFIQLGSIVRTSGSEPGGYNNTGLTANLVRGNAYTLTFSTGFSSTIRKEYWRIYIDYNGDGDFTDAGESVLNTSQTGSGNFTGVFTVPATASLTTTRMRVKMSRNSISSSCGSFSSGEVEDYTIIVSASPFAFSKNVSNELNVESDSWKIAVVPNPIKDEINISLNDTYGQNTNITLFDVNGRIILSHSLSKNDFNYQLNVPDLANGMYFLFFQNGDLRKTIKIIK